MMMEVIFNCHVDIIAIDIWNMLLGIRLLVWL